MSIEELIRTVRRHGGKWVLHLDGAVELLGPNDFPEDLMREVRMRNDEIEAFFKLRRSLNMAEAIVLRARMEALGARLKLDNDGGGWKVFQDTQKRTVAFRAILQHAQRVGNAMLHLLTLEAAARRRPPSHP